MKKVIILLTIIIVPVIYIISCKKDKGQPPVLPPYESMIIDFSNFSTQKKSAVILSEVKGTESSTWEFAATVSGIWSSLIESNLAIPIASFEAAADNNPAYASDKLWQWSYNFSVAGTAYKARLTGQTSTNQVIWKMYITNSASGGFTDFLWLEGTSKTDGSGGQWTFKQSPQVNETMFQTDWAKSGTSITSVKYTYLKNDTYKNSYIIYSLTTGTFDASFAIHFANDSYANAQIEWNTTTNNGRLNCLSYLQDQNWYCWDSNLINVLCE